MKVKSVVSPRQYTVSQVNENYGQIVLRIASSPLAPSEYWLLSDLKRRVLDMRFGLNFLNK